MESGECQLNYKMTKVKSMREPKTTRSGARPSPLIKSNEARRLSVHRRRVPALSACSKSAALTAIWAQTQSTYHLMSRAVETESQRSHT